MKPEYKFEYDGKTYVIHLTMKRVMAYESTHTPIMTTLVRNGGGLSLAEMQGLIANGLELEDGGFVGARQGTEIATGLIEKYGYAEMLSVLSDVLERDCGFFFKTPTDTVG